MRLIVILAAIFVIPAVGLSSVPNEYVEKEKVSAADRAHIKTVLGQLPLYFIENQGQMDEEVYYYVKGLDKTLYFTSKGITFALTGKDGIEEKRWAVKLEFVGANEVEPKGEEKQKAVFSYFKGKEENWKKGLATYRRIVYEDLWPGVDLIYKGTVNQLKYEFVVNPGADPAQIRLKYCGASEASVKETGALRVLTPVGGFVDGVPLAYQVVDGVKNEVCMRYVVEQIGDDVFSYGFGLGNYDRTQRLFLDPDMLVYCGYIGGIYDESECDIAIDSKGNAYVAGFTDSDQSSFPVKIGPDLTYNGGNEDFYLAKINTQGIGLEYCGYIGGIEWEKMWPCIAIDSEGNAYVTGTTESDQSSFPVKVGPDLTWNGVCDAFVAKVKADGTDLVYCGYIGGSDQDYSIGIAVDILGNAYATGWTISDENSFPVKIGPDLTYNGDWDGYVAKVNAFGTGLVYCGYIGGTDADLPQMDCIKVNSKGNAFVTGRTFSTESSFPVKIGPDLTHNGGQDGFVAKVKADGTDFVYCGYIGGVVDDSCNGIAVDSYDNAYVTGSTKSIEKSFPVKVGPDLTHNGGTDGFVAKVRADGTDLVYCGYIGGNFDDGCNGIAVDSGDNVYVTGKTKSDEKSFPVKVGPDLTHNGEWDAFVAKINNKGTNLEYCGYIGGEKDDGYWGNIAVESSGNVYVVGSTESDETSFPVKLGPDLTFNGDRDAFVAKVIYIPSLTADSDTISENTGGTVNFTLDAGPPNANRNYLLLGSISGTVPGILLPKGKVTLPLNWDLFTNLVINLLNTPVFSNFMGQLDGSGTASAKLDTLGPLPPGSAGLILYFAYALNNRWDFASNPVEIEIVP